MQLHQIKPHRKLKNKKRVGRGGKRGTYSGRGLKGQKSRAGAKIRPALRDLIIRLPKKRGYKFKSIRLKPAIVNLKDIENNFKEGEIVSPRTLLEKKLINRQKGKLPKVKILGQGKLTKKLKFENCEFSESAKSQIAI